MSDALIYVRAIHFAATILIAGVIFFDVVIAAPAYRMGDDTCVPLAMRGWLRWTTWGGLAAAVISGAAWLLLVATAMSSEALRDVLTDGVLGTVLTQTTFGRDWLIRSVLACALAATLAPFLTSRNNRPMWLNCAVLILAAALVGSLAWAGHAAGGLGSEALVHPAADVLHLIAAAAWVGALPPLLVLLALAGSTASSVAIARAAVVRFSSTGIISVAMLLITGSINTWYLVGGVPALIGTDYGRLLLEKVVVFFGMVLLAAANRLWLTPQLLQKENAETIRGALFQLRYHVSLEIAGGACVIVIVAILGTLHPGLHELHVH